MGSKDEQMEKALADAPAPRVTLEMLNKKLRHAEIVKHVTHTGQILRWAVLTMENGFAVTGRPSAAVCPENDNVAIGEEIAIDNAMNEAWTMEGYLLAERLERTRLAEVSIVAAIDQRDEAERAVLGCILLKERMFTAVMEVLRVEDFRAEAHRLIYAVMLDMMMEGEPIDLLSLTNQLHEYGDLEEVGGAAYLAGLTSTVPATGNVATFASRVRRCAILDELNRMTQDIAGVIIERNESPVEDKGI